MRKFEDFGLSKTLEKSILNMGFTNPTPVQEQSIPVALEGRDILGSAQTGTGKTAAFLIPLIQKLMREEITAALVLTPTRELAKQVLDVTDGLLFGQNAINTACLIGGEQITKQLKQLKRRPRIVVGTPGRINDHLERKSLKLNNLKYLVLDETDRMLDMGFGVQIDRILKHVPKVRQTLMFSATLPEQIVKLSTKYLTTPERISIGKTNVVATNIDNEIIKIKKEDKYQLLLEQIEKREGTLLIFVKTKHGTVKMAKKLSHDHFRSEPLNGNLRQSKRDTVMKKFREKKFRIMVATDIAARGLDVPHIEHVINYDLPQLAEDHIHRLGRTGRANAVGSAVTFVSTKELDKWNEIERMLDPSIQRTNNKNKLPISSKKNKFFKKNKSRSKLLKTKDDNHKVKYKSSFYNKKKKTSDSRFERVKNKKKTFSKLKKSFSGHPSELKKFSKRGHPDESNYKKSSFYKKKKRTDISKFKKDDETAVSFFKKKRTSKYRFNKEIDTKRNSFRKKPVRQKMLFKSGPKKKRYGKPSRSN